MKNIIDKQMLYSIIVIVLALFLSYLVSSMGAVNQVNFNNSVNQTNPTAVQTQFENVLKDLEGDGGLEDVTGAQVGGGSMGLGIGLGVTALIIITIALIILAKAGSSAGANMVYTCSVPGLMPTCTAWIVIGIAILISAIALIIAGSKESKGDNDDESNQFLDTQGDGFGKAENLKDLKNEITEEINRNADPTQQCGAPGASFVRTDQLFVENKFRYMTTYRVGGCDNHVRFSIYLRGEREDKIREGIVPLKEIAEETFPFHTSHQYTHTCLRLDTGTVCHTITGTQINPGFRTGASFVK